MKILSGHQPNYMPYPGLIGKILHSDKFIYVSNVQLEKKSWQNRNRIKGANGEIMLSVPVLTKGKFDQTIKETRINNQLEWGKKHFQAINLNYKKSKYYNRYIDFFEDLYKKNWECLNELDIYIMNWILKELNIKTKVYYDTDYKFEEKNNQLLIEMTKQLECDTYLSNKGSESYVNIDLFREQNLNHIYINYLDVEYKQLFKQHIPYLSIIDMLFNLGSEETYEILADDKNYQFSKMNEKLG